MTSLHNSEVVTIEGLIATATDNTDTLTEAEKMDSSKLAKKKENYRKRRMKYFHKSTSEETPDHLIPELVIQQKELMTKVTILKMVEEQRETSETSSDYSEVAMSITTELCTRQKVEIRNFETVLEEIQDETLIKEIIKILKRAKNEFWSPNITATLLYPKFVANDGPLIAKEWIRLAKMAMNDNIGEVIMDKKIAEKRLARRREENIPNKYNTLGREKTVVDINITAEEQNKYMQKIKRVNYSLTNVINIFDL